MVEVELKIRLNCHECPDYYESDICEVVNPSERGWAREVEHAVEAAKAEAEDQDEPWVAIDSDVTLCHECAVNRDYIEPRFPL